MLAIAIDRAPAAETHRRLEAQGVELDEGVQLRAGDQQANTSMRARAHPRERTCLRSRELTWPWSSAPETDVFPAAAPLAPALSTPSIMVSVVI
jgi:hypothetical protein